ncbi:uncharacterized protein UDID_17090 [Ustilago sp. UG-2017a]|nr:uncharacterized protein UDID_17090 [Ustilago sp. UG-2017a]
MSSQGPYLRKGPVFCHQTERKEEVPLSIGEEGGKSLTEDCFYRLASNTTTSASHSLERISLTNPKSFPAESETEPPVRHKVFPDLHLPITALITDSIQRLLRFSAARHKKASSQAQEILAPEHRAGNLSIVWGLSVFTAGIIAARKFGDLITPHPKASALRFPFSRRFASVMLSDSQMHFLNLTGRADEQGQGGT